MVIIVALLFVVALVAAGMTVVRRARLGANQPKPAQTVPSADARPAATAETRAVSDDAPLDPMARLVGFLRQRQWARRALSGLSVLLLLGAVGMIGWPYFTNLYQDRVQSNLDGELASGDLEQRYRSRSLDEGDALTRLKIPSLDVDVVVVEGVTASALRAGAGHYPSSPMPCEVGNVAIAGHRTTYGRPLHNMDLLKDGDTIILETPIGKCTYEVTAEPFVVPPTQVEVVENTPEEAMLTLTTCHPKGSARQRLILHATMIQSEFFEA